MKPFRYVLLALAAAMLTTACGGGGGGSSATPNYTISGQVVDGYVQGSRVYIVPVADDTAARALYTSATPSDELGRFYINGLATGVVQDVNGNLRYKLLGVGGTDTATGVPVGTAIYTAPLDAKVLTPLTTLAMQIAENLSAGGPVSRANLNIAIQRIAEVAGIDGAVANDIILGTDPVGNAFTDVNTQRALTLDLVIQQLTAQNLVDGVGNFNTTIATLAAQLSADVRPLSLTALATGAVGNDETAQAMAEVIVASAGGVITQMAAATPADANVADIAQSLEVTFASQLSTLLGGVNPGNISGMTTQIVASTTNEALGAIINNLFLPADLSNTTVKNYLLQKASDAGVADLLGVDVLGIAPGNITIPVAGKLVSSAKSLLNPSAKTVFAVQVVDETNPCSEEGNANAVLDVTCADIFGADVCEGVTPAAFGGSLVCADGMPTSINILMDGFDSPIIQQPLSGEVTINNSTIAFTGVTTGTTTYTGVLNYTAGVNTALDFSVVSMTVNSNRWDNLVLDSFSTGKLITVADDGENAMTMFISGTGRLKGVAGLPLQTLSLTYRHGQDASKTANPDVDFPYVDHAWSSVDGQILDGANNDVVRFSNFKVDEVRYYSLFTDEQYAKKDANFVQGSRISTGLYGYADFFSSNLVWTFDSETSRPEYTSGSLQLSN